VRGLGVGGNPVAFTGPRSGWWRASGWASWWRTSWSVSPVPSPWRRIPRGPAPWWSGPRTGLWGRRPALI